MQNSTFVGKLVRNPVLTVNNECDVCKFTLISNEFIEKDKESGEIRERVVCVQFTAFKDKAKVIAKHTLKGDQLHIGYRIENNHYIDKTTGEDVYGYNFIVKEFEFGSHGKLTRDKFNNSYSKYNQ